MEKELDLVKLKSIYDSLKAIAPNVPAKLALKKIHKTTKQETEIDFQILANPSGYIQYGLEMLKAVIESHNKCKYQINKDGIDFTYSDFFPLEIQIDETIIPEAKQESKLSGLLGCLIALIIVFIMVIGLKG